MRCRRVAAALASVLLGVLLAAPLSAITIKAAINFDGTWTTLYRAGNKPIGGGDTCLSGFTCAALGTATGQFDDQSATAINISATTGSHEDGIAAVYKTFGSETNRHLEFRITGITGSQSIYAGGGAFISDDDADFSTPDYKSYVWWPVQGRIRFKTDVGGAGQAGQTGTNGVAIPYYGGLEYTASTNTLTGWNSSDGMTWTQIGTGVVHAFNTGRYGFWCNSDDPLAQSTCAITSIVDNTTLSFSGTPPVTETSDTTPYADPVASTTLAGGRVTANCNSTGTCQTAYNNAACGTDVVFAGGVSYGAMTIDKSCDATVPIRLVGNGPTWTSDVTGTWGITGARNIITGFDFSATTVRINFGGTNNRLLGNRIHGYTSTAGAAILVYSGSFGEIAYNECYSPGPWPVTTYPLNICVRTAENSTLTDLHINAWVHHNYFHDFPAKPNPAVYNSGQDDAIELGQSTVGAQVPTKTTGWYIEYNLVERHLQGHGTIDLKLPAVVRYNTFQDTPGRIDQRSPTASGSIIESNYFENSGGMTLHGDNNRIIGNILTNTPGEMAGAITLNSGDLESNEAQTDGSQHARVTDAFVIGNQGILRVGLKGNANADMAVLRTTIEEHEDCADITTSGTSYLSSNTTNNCAMASAVNFITAVKLIGRITSGPNGTGTIISESPDVGPSALANAPAAYCAARGC